MTIRIGINGFGRIGRDYLRYSLTTDDIEVVAVNDIVDAATMARLLRYDSTFGPLGVDIEEHGDTLVVDGHKIRVSSQRDPAALAWGEEAVDIVIESTGKFRTRDAAAAHLTAGAAKVLISSPGKGVDTTIVMGVNDESYDPAAHHVVSNASCSTKLRGPHGQGAARVLWHRARLHDHRARLHKRPECP